MSQADQPRDAHRLPGRRRPRRRARSCRRRCRSSPTRSRPTSGGKAIATWAGLAGAGGAIGPILLAGSCSSTSGGDRSSSSTSRSSPCCSCLGRMIVPTSKDPDGHAARPDRRADVGRRSRRPRVRHHRGPGVGLGQPGVIASFVVAAVFLVGFVLWELRTPTPTLDPRLFRLPRLRHGQPGDHARRSSACSGCSS